MVMGINSNTASLNAQRSANAAQSSLSTPMARLSSGLRINTAKDDSAGLAISERMDAQVRGMNVAIRNANDGVSMTQTAEGGLATVGNMLQRMRELSVQAVNTTNQTGDLSAMDKEYQQLSQEIGRTLRDTQFNGVSVLSGVTADYEFQVGANAGQTITIGSGDLNAADGATNPALGEVITGAASAIDSATNANNSANITALDAAIQAVNEQRASLGAVQSRFDNTISNLQSSVENQTAAKGRIKDADFATESANLSRSQTLSQASTAMIAQANQLSQGVMSLLR